MPYLHTTAAAILLLQLSAFFIANAQTARSASPAGPGALSGLNASRLAPKDLERWRAIEELVFAEDGKHQPLHPTIRGMWEWLETSGHLVYVEIVRSTRAATCTAGNFSIEYFDPRGERHIGVIKLHLGNIDLAYVGPSAARENGFVPFEGLSKEERYVEVLGHELAHAVDILTTPEHARRVEMMVEKTNEMLLSGRPRRKGESVTPELKTRLGERDRLLLVLEKRAETMETTVWRELIESKTFREKVLPLSARR
jgi:hypothetical protein